MTLGPLKECVWKTFFLHIVKLRPTKSCCCCGDTIKLNLLALVSLGLLVKFGGTNHGVENTIC